MREEEQLEDSFCAFDLSPSNTLLFATALTSPFGA